jgi:hypothetical protein
MKHICNSLRRNILIGAGSLCLMAAAPQTWAQGRVTAKASLDSTYVIIGSPTTIHLEVTAPEGVGVQFPQLRKSIAAQDGDETFQLEISGVTATDTVRQGQSLTLSRDVEVYAFDSATLYLPPFPFVTAPGDTAWTNALALKVIVPFDVEVDPQKYCDIKAPLKPDFVWTDYLGWVLWPLLALLVVAAAVYYFVYYRPRHRREHVEAPKPKVVLPPHEVALAALQALESKKLWQEGHVKRYYTELTDILRAYMDGRFRVSTMEQTSDEILQTMRLTDGITNSSLQNLRQVLQLADLVKFARLEPLADENQLSLVNAKMFISQTVEVKSVDTTAAITDVPGAEEQQDEPEPSKTEAQ